MKKAKNKVKAYKGFNADWTCRGFQFEVGKTYTHDGGVQLCSSGFHACEYPLDIFGYYPPTGQMAEVTLTGVTSPEKTGDSKRAGKSITIKAALTIPLLVAAAIEYTVKRCDPVKAQHSTGDQSASSATGDRSASSATGDQSAASATGANAVAAAFGVASTVKAGVTGILIAAYWDGPRKRLVIGYVGEEGIKPDVWYRVVDGKLTEVV